MQGCAVESVGVSWLLPVVSGSERITALEGVSIAWKDSTTSTSAGPLDSCDLCLRRGSTVGSGEGWILSGFCVTGLGVFWLLDDSAGSSVDGGSFDFFFGMRGKVW